MSPRVHQLLGDASRTRRGRRGRLARRGPTPRPRHLAAAGGGPQPTPQPGLLPFCCGARTSGRRARAFHTANLRRSRTRGGPLTPLVTKVVETPTWVFLEENCVIHWQFLLQKLYDNIFIKNGSEIVTRTNLNYNIVHHIVKELKINLYCPSTSLNRATLFYFF